MNQPMFRDLRADEVECRIAICKKNGVTLLLYKDARCDQNILDETVGAMNWQRRHSRDNANCTVEIWDSEKRMWIAKEDTGTESNTEKEKGLASDSFKRACFNWGIGRELYTAPFIFIKADKCSIQEKDGRFFCYDRFDVAAMTVENKRITALRITCKGKTVYELGKTLDEEPPEQEAKRQPRRSDAPATVEVTTTATVSDAKKETRKLDRAEQYTKCQAYLGLEDADMSNRFETERDAMGYPTEMTDRQFIDLIKRLAAKKEGSAHEA